MCGRFASYRATQDLVDAYDVDEVEDDAGETGPSWNVAPTQGVRVVLDRSTDDGARRELHVATWGLVPGWATDRRIGNRLINARRESLETKAAFRESLRRRRCIVPVDGYYEWQQRGGVRQPVYVTPTSGEPLALAGLYAFWRDPQRADDDPQRWVLSTTIVTAPAQGPLAEIHDRVPAALSRAAVDAWLDPATERPERALAALDSTPPPLRHYEVSTRVNTPAVDDPGLIDPL